MNIYESQPELENNKTKTNVAEAVIVSPRIMSNFLLYLSPQLPAKTEIIICGI